jgi:hypothetical protein
MPTHDLGRGLSRPSPGKRASRHGEPSTTLVYTHHTDTRVVDLHIAGIVTKKTRQDLPRRPGCGAHDLLRATDPRSAQHGIRKPSLRFPVPEMGHRHFRTPVSHLVDGCVPRGQHPVRRFGCAQNDAHRPSRSGQRGSHDPSRDQMCLQCLHCVTFSTNLRRQRVGMQRDPNARERVVEGASTIADRAFRWVEIPAPTRSPLPRPGVLRGWVTPNPLLLESNVRPR